MRRRVAALVGLAVVLSGCGAAQGTTTTLTSASGSSEPTTSAAAPTGGTTYELTTGVTVEAPAAWYSADYLGYPAPVWFPLRFLSTHPLTGPCTTGTPRGSCAPHNFFPGDWVTPEDGVVLLWSETQFPLQKEPALQNVAGEVTSLDGHRAKVSSGPAGAGCPAGAATELDAAVERHVGTDPGVWMDLIACFGPKASAPVHHDVEAMLATLRLSD